MTDPQKAGTGTLAASQAGREGYARWAGAILSLLVIAWFYGVFEAYGPGRSQSAIAVLASSWNSETDYQHGWLFPLIIGGLIIYRWRDLNTSAGPGDRRGLLAVFIGVLLFAAAYRVIQWRVAVASLPFVVWGSALYLWGWRTAKLLAFPIFFIWLSVPLPNFQQATVPLQKIATVLAHAGAELCGVDTYVKGTEIYSQNQNWEPLSIAGGCSGIRSLMALIMISATWAYLAKISLARKLVLFVAAFPLAILGNALRLTSIFVIAEHGNAEFARTTWHDWSGLLLFYPFSLILLLALHSILEGGLPWRRKRRVVRTVVAAGGTIENDNAQATSR